MKKIVCIVTLLLTVTTFAQKDELKTLKKIYGKETVTDKDLTEFKANLTALEGLNLDEDQAVYAKFYKVMYPTLELFSKGNKVTLMDQAKVYTPNFVKEYGKVINETMTYEAKTGKKVYYDDLVTEKQQFVSQLKNSANDFYKNSKFNEASSFFYLLYTFDPNTQGSELENAAISAVQAKNYVLAEKLYEEYKNSDYLNNGVLYFATNKASGQEEIFATKEDRSKSIAIGVHEKPRSEKVSNKKPEVYKMLGILASNNGNFDKAKSALEEARKLAPNDKEISNEEARIYFNEGYELIKEDQKLVDEINANTDNTAKYNELMAKRKATFEKALPSFEKAYSLNPTDVNIKSLLKNSYQILGKSEKADAVK